MIEIFTLGHWNIKKNNETILTSKGYQEKLLNLFKYLLVHEGQRLSPEKIINDLLANEDYYDPRKTLRTQISRVRYMFEYNDFFKIEFARGYYVLRLVEDTVVDFRRFDYLMNQANTLIDRGAEADLDKAFQLMEKGLSYYRGELYDLVTDDWVIPLRTRYNRLYVRSVYNYLRVLKRQKEYKRIIEIAEKAIESQPYEEALNVYFMEALIKTDQREYALNHYEYFTRKLYNDLKMKPSQEIKNVYNLIRDGSPKKEVDDGQEESSETILRSKLLERTKTEKALLSKKCSCNNISSCNLKLFNFLYEDKEMEEDAKREKGNYFVSLNIRRESQALERPENIESLKKLKTIVETSLRSDDVLFQCKTGTILLMLYDISYYEVMGIKKRLEKSLRDETMNPSLDLEIKLQSI